jgi:hypothetical protein
LSLSNYAPIGLVALSVCITAFGTVVYIGKIFRREAGPNLVSWSVWSISPVVGAHVALSSGAGNIEVARTVAAGILSLMVLVAIVVSSFSWPKFSVSDVVCGVLALGSIFLWLVKSLPYDATFAALLADGIAAFPTVASARRKPYHEALSPYLAGGISSLLAVFAQESSEFLCLVYPVYLVALNLLIVTVIILARGEEDDHRVARYHE